MKHMQTQDLPGQTLLQALTQLDTDVAPMTDTQARALYRRALQKAGLQAEELPQTDSLPLTEGAAEGEKPAKRRPYSLRRLGLRIAAMVAVCSGALVLAGMLGHGFSMGSKGTDNASGTMQNAEIMDTATGAGDNGVARYSDEPAAAPGEDAWADDYDADGLEAVMEEGSPENGWETAQDKAQETALPLNGGIDLKTVRMYAPAGARQVQYTVNGDPTLYFMLEDVEYRLVLAETQTVMFYSEEQKAEPENDVEQEYSWLREEVFGEDGSSYQVYYDIDEDGSSCAGWSEEGVWYRLTSNEAGAEAFAAAAAEVVRANAGEVRAALEEAEP